MSLFYGKTIPLAKDSLVGLSSGEIESSVAMLRFMAKSCNCF